MLMIELNVIEISDIVKIFMCVVFFYYSILVIGSVIGRVALTAGRYDIL